MSSSTLKTYALHIKMTEWERERLKLEAERRKVSMGELIRSWVHRLPPSEGETDPN